MFVSAQNFQSSDPTFDSEMVIPQSCGVDALLLHQLCASPRASAATVRRQSNMARRSTGIFT
jgi:hypothetical protein